MRMHAAGCVQGSLNSLNQQFRRALISPTARLYLIASLFEVIELTVSHMHTRHTRSYSRARGHTDTLLLSTERVPRLPCAHDHALDCMPSVLH